MWGMLNVLVGALTWSVLAEVLLLRTFLRLGPVLPVKEELLPVYRAVETAGLAAMNLAMLAAAGVAVGIAWLLLAQVDSVQRIAETSRQPENCHAEPQRSISWPTTRRPFAAAQGDRTYSLQSSVHYPQRRAVAVLLGGLILAAVLANLALTLLLPVLPAPTAVALPAATLLAALLAIYAATSGRRRGRLALGLIAGAESLALAHLLAPGLAGLGLPLPGAGALIFFAEAAALAAALVLPWSLGPHAGFRPRWRRRDLVVGVILAIALLAAHTLRPSLLVAMTMWNLSFSLFLPGIVYAGAFGAFAATLLALWREGPTGRAAATGLLLIALAGLKLDFTYFNLIALVGFLLCCQPLGVSARRGLLRSPTSLP